MPLFRFGEFKLLQRFRRYRAHAIVNDFYFLPAYPVYVVRQGADQKVCSAQSACLYLLIDDAPFPFRYSERIGDSSVSFYCFFLDNFSSEVFVLPQRVLGESISPNEAR